jgi:hypothetical protein
VRPGAGREHGERAEGARGQAQGSEEKGERDTGRWPAAAGPQLLRHQPGSHHSGVDSALQGLVQVSKSFRFSFVKFYRKKFKN